MKKIGIFLVTYNVILLIICILYDSNYNELMLMFSMLSIGILLPFGSSLIVINLPEIKRNKVKKIYLIISLFCLGFGVFSRLMHWPGASIEIITGVVWYCFSYAPLQLKSKFIKWKPFSKSKFETLFLSLADFLGINFFLLGLLFKMQRWPFADILLNLGLIIISLALLFWNWKFKKEVVLRKKSEDCLKEKNQEILDSINYAKRIQSAILPQPKLVKQFLEDSFVLYKPKDIVAGDFYWLEVVGDVVLFAAADCTGHGVPGAMVSVVCNNGLNRAVREFGLTNPNEILDKTREIVITEFEKSQEDVKDGMDISLCALKPKENKMFWAGAHNPLWIIRNNEIIEIKADKQPIGKYANPKPFTLHEFQLNNDDIIYIFTDGYQDQFGGPNEKKFRASQMKELFLSISEKPMEEQRNIIDEKFENWKGELDQIDDVCVIGVRV